MGLPFAFIRAVFHHWIVLMGGGVVTIILGLYERWSGKTVAGIVYVVIIFVLVVFACFLAWRDKNASVRVLSHDEGYNAVRNRTRTASFEILKLIYYELDQNGRPIYDPALLQSESRKATYLEEREKLKKERGKDKLRFVEIVQIPSGASLESIMANDPVYRENCEFLADLGKAEPEFATLRVSDVIFPNTVILIDRAFLYIAFRIKNPETGLNEYPFIGILIEDKQSEFVKRIVKLHQRIEARSRLVTIQQV